MKEIKIVFKLIGNTPHFFHKSRYLKATLRRLQSKDERIDSALRCTHNGSLLLNKWGLLLLKTVIVIDIGEFHRSKIKTSYIEMKESNSVCIFMCLFRNEFDLNIHWKGHAALFISDAITQCNRANWNDFKWYTGWFDIK